MSISTSVLDFALELAEVSSDRKAYTFVASTGAEDRNHNRIDPAGWQLDDFGRNPVVFANHQWGTPIGRASRVWIERDQLMATIEFADTDRAKEIRQLVDGGFLRGMSAGWIGLDFAVVRDEKTGWPSGVHYKRQVLVELSVVGIPANPEALRVAAATNQLLVERMIAAVLDVSNSGTVR
ncbi:MAG: HK97 family phage prohead protease, partial [Chloroflexi bacterium]|nr:HK97 family phage prohead protease [Chloroflexota bacterium]